MFITRRLALIPVSEAQTIKARCIEHETVIEPISAICVKIKKIKNFLGVVSNALHQGSDILKKGKNSDVRIITVQELLRKVIIPMQ